MADAREVLGSWLEGPRGAGIEYGYPGERLGLVESGPGSVARFGTRLLAFAIDAIACGLIAAGLFGNSSWSTAVFAVEVLVLTATLGGSAGQLVLGVRLVRLGGTRAGIGPVLLRTR